MTRARSAAGELVRVSPLLFEGAVIARSVSDEAILKSSLLPESWIASLLLAMTTEGRQPPKV